MATQRGPKMKAKLAPREPLPVEPPAELGLSVREKKIYRSIAQRVLAEGFGGMSDARTVALAAVSSAAMERLNLEVAALPSLMMGDRLSPLVIEARLARTQLTGALAALLLTPKSRLAARISEQQFRQAGATRDSLEEFLEESP